MDATERTHKQELMKTYIDRLRKLELRHAQEGAECPPHVLNDIERIRKTIQEIENELRDVQQSSTVSSQSIEVSVSNLDSEVVSHIQKFVEMIQNSSKIQLYIDTCNDIINCIEGSGSEEDLITIFLPLIKLKTDWLMNESRIRHICYYILGRSYFIAKDYENCIENLNYAISLIDSHEYRYFRVEARAARATQLIEEHDKFRLSDSINLLDLAKDQVDKAKEDLDYARNMGGSNQVYRSLRKTVEQLSESLNSRASSF